jgi:predicted ABC-type ATPase
MENAWEYGKLTKKCYIFAGPNGAGKTTFANEFLPKIYKPLADSWIVFDTSGSQPVIVDKSEA